MGEIEPTREGESTENGGRRYPGLLASRRAALEGALGLGGLALLGSGGTGTAAGSANQQPVRRWRTDVNARGHDLFNLGRLAMDDNRTWISDFEGDHLFVDASGLLNVNRGSVSPWDDVDGDGLLEPQGVAGIDVDRVVASNAVETARVGTTTDAPLAVVVEDEPALRLERTSAGAAPNVIAGDPSNAIAADVEGATIAGGGPSDPLDPATGNRALDDWSTIGGGADNEAGRGPPLFAQYTTVSGGVGNTASFVGATVGGGENNTAAGHRSTIGGGRDNTTAATSGPTIGGGENNTASGLHSTVGGGIENTAFNTHTTVGGGRKNTASGNDSTVAGGENNSAGGVYAAIGGGVQNTADGDTSAVPGGSNNVASGRWSLAAGRSAKTETSGGTVHHGARVFGDSSSTLVRSERADQFVVQAGGGVKLYSSSDLSTYAELPPGSTGWSFGSARDTKNDVEPVDPGAVLGAVEGMEISTWCYESQQGVTHMGPMAGSFHDAFGLGEDADRISTIDADGVALAAIQGLADRLDDRTGHVDDLERENEALRQRVASLESQVADLAAAVTGAGLA